MYLCFILNRFKYIKKCDIVAVKKRPSEKLKQNHGSPQKKGRFAGVQIDDPSWCTGVSSPRSLRPAIAMRIARAKKPY